MRLTQLHKTSLSNEKMRLAMKQRHCNVMDHVLFFGSLRSGIASHKSNVEELRRHKGDDPWEESLDMHGCRCWKQIFSRR